MVTEIDRQLPADGKAPAPEKIEGVVVNQRAVYKCTASPTIPGHTVTVKNPDKLTGIAHDKVLMVNIWRMMFAGGKLTLKLDEREVIKEAGITSQTGVTTASKTSDTGLQKRQELIKQRKEDD
jgi:hypothetical protein